MNHLLEIDGLHASFGHGEKEVKAVRGVSFHIEKGETVALVGESGSGKSVTALSAMRLLPYPLAHHPEGAIRFKGEELLSAPDSRMRELRGADMAMIFQEPLTSLNPLHSIEKQIAETLLLHKAMTPAEARARVIELLNLVGLEAATERLSALPHEFSGGQQQRVMIAMALANDPDLLIADEPTTALDVTIQAQILLLLAELQREFDMGLILITHDLGVVARVADRVAVMYAGQIVESGAAKQVFENPTHPYTQGLLECIPIPGKTQRGQHLGSIPGIVPSLVGDLKGCRFAERCNYAMPECSADDVALRTGVEDGHQYRCLLSTEQCAENLKTKVPA